MKLLLWWAFLFVLVGFGSLQAETILIQDVSFKSQSPPGDWANNMNCGPTAALVLGAYYKRFDPETADLESLLDWLYAEGLIYPQAYAEYYDGNVTNVWHLEQILEDFFLLGEVKRNNSLDYDFLRQELVKGNPVIVGVNINMNATSFGHFMVVVGLSDTEVIVHDPGKTYGEYNHYSLNKFQASWATSNYASIVVQSKGAVWYPDGSLIQVVGDSKVYLVKDQKLYWIKDEIVFNAHHFDWLKIIPVRSKILDCFQYGGEIEIKPYRELYKVDDTYYLYEKPTFIANSCTLSQFASLTALNSWKLPLLVQEIDSISGLYGSCMHGTTLYFRDGTLIKPTEAAFGFGEGVVFVATNNGELKPFVDWETFQLMGYDQLELFHVVEVELQGGARFFGEAISQNDALFCGESNYEIQIVTEPELIDNDGDGMSEEEGDCDDQNPFVYLGAEEICDELDNDCNGEEDDGLVEECATSCGVGIHYCEDGHWNGCEILDFTLEIEDGLDNDCDGLIDEGFVIPEDTSPLDVDNDNDGYTPNEGDCDDWSPETNPGHPEICDSLDNNCNFLIDEGDVCAEGDSVTCSFSCPTEMNAHVWFGIASYKVGQSLDVTIPITELCLRGQPWLDFNCVCKQPEWSCFDWSVANIHCNKDHQIIEGSVDFSGEGEVWFPEVVCQ